MHQSPKRRVVIFYNVPGRVDTWEKDVLYRKGSHILQALDVDNDGDTDFFGANWESSAPDGAPVILWKNQAKKPPRSMWKRHVIDPRRPHQAIFISAGDINGDTLADIITGGWWYTNPGSLARPWHRFAIGDSLYGAAAAADFDYDGQKAISYQQKRFPIS